MDLKLDPMDEAHELMPRCDNPSRWIRENTVEHCMSCSDNFSLLKRKHHCRACGKVYCHSCSSEKLLVSGFNGPQRACFSCYADLAGITKTDLKLVHNTCNALGDIPFYFTLVILRDRERHKGILVVCKALIVMIHRESKKVLFKINLLELTNINIMGGPNVFTIGGGRKSPAFQMGFESSKAPEAIKAIREVHRDLIIGFPVEYTLKVESPPERLLNIDLKMGPIPLASNFCNLYKACCFMLGGSASESVKLHIENLARQEIIELDFSEIPGVEENSAITCDLNPICAALEHNSYFRGVVVNNVLRKSMIPTLCRILQLNQYITRVKIINMKEGVSKLFELGSALSSNKEHAVQEIIISETNINEKCIKTLTDAIAGFTHSLKTLVLSDCGLSPRMLSYLIKAGIMKNLGLALNLQELNLSHNKFDDESSNQLSNFLLKIAEFSQLRKISLVKCSLNVAAVIRPFNSLKHLSEIDLSQNRLDQVCSHLLCSVIETSNNLNTIILSSCSLSAPAVEMILSAIVSNKHLYNVKIDLSDNPIGDKGISSIATHLSRGSNLHTLNLSRMKIGDAGLSSLSKALLLLKDYSLESLYLDDAQGTSPQVARLLVEAVSMISSLKFLSLSSGYSSSFLLSFLDGMKSNTNLHELNLSYNKLADHGAPAIAALIRDNRYLLALNCDYNKISLTGYQAIYGSFFTNKTLTHFEFPWSDFSASVATLPKGKTSVLRSLLMKIQTVCITNRQSTASLPPRLKDVIDDLPLNFVQPLAEIPPSLLEETDPTSVVHDETTLSFDLHVSGESLQTTNQSSSSSSSAVGSNNGGNVLSPDYYLQAYHQSAPLVENPISWNVPPLSHSPPFEISHPEKYAISSSSSDPPSHKSPVVESSSSSSASAISFPPPPPPSSSTNYSFYDAVDNNYYSSSDDDNNDDKYRDDNNKHNANNSNPSLSIYQSVEVPSQPPPPPPAPIQSIPPPPPPSGGLPPPPPPPPAALPPPQAGRSALLDSISGFSKNKLKKTVTVDKCALKK